MVPNTLGFHDAVVVDLHQEGDLLVWHIEDVEETHGIEQSERWTHVNGELIYEGVSHLKIDDRDAPGGILFEGSNGGIRVLRNENGHAMIDLVWESYDPPKEVPHRYSFKYRAVEWKQMGVADA